MAVARRNRGLFAATPLALGALVLSGCTIAAHADAPASTFAVSTLDSALAPEDASSADAEATFANDEWDSDAAVTITLDGTTASADGAGVTIDGATVTITATGTYLLTGELRGQVIVAAPAGAVVALVLDGATISSDDAAATATAPVTPTEGTEDSVAPLEGDELDSTGSATASSGSYATPTQSPSRARVIAT